jgi:O-acetyl-ADP-ribose deacetylase (regulator of RNase III)
MDIRFIFCDPKEDLCNEWIKCINEKLTIKERLAFTVIQGVLDNVKKHFKFDCIVSPANCYGRLDGAFDLVISKMFCKNNPDVVINHCQEYLYAIHNGYQPTGTCCIIPMHGFDNIFDCTYIAHCPTMRIPSNCRWNKEVVYNCMWSLLNEIRIYNHNKPKQSIKTVFMTGLGTGVGRFPSDVCAEQMIVAYKHYMRNLAKECKLTSWREIRDDSLDIENTFRKISFFENEQDDETGHDETGHDEQDDETGHDDEQHYSKSINS